VIVACFVVSVILNTLVREKTKDIGILRSIGFSSRNIMKIFMIEGTVLGSIGIVAGIIMSSVVMYFLENYSMKLPLDIYYLEKLPFKISLQEILIIVGITFIIIFISSIFPAYRAAKLRPVEALKYD
jgi:lipoprotein-releasing system permease protein